ncbi:MAG: DUF6666 family protein [Planctomycetota bacterium]
MFRPQLLKTFVILLTVGLGIPLTAGAQTPRHAAYQARLDAMQQARARAAAPAQPTPIDQQAPQDENVEQVAYDQVVYDQQVQYEQPGQYVAPPAQMPRNARPMNRRPARMMNQQGRVVPAGYHSHGNGPHTHVAQLHDGAMVDGGMNVVGSSVMNSPVVDSSMQLHDHSIGVPYTDGGMMYDEYGGCADGGCYDMACGDSCYDRGGCPPGTPCWLDNLCSIGRNGEYFVGATGFKGPSFQLNGQDVHDCGFGFYGGFNVGVPLCNLTCGMLTGQLGVRSVQTQFNGSAITPENRDQLFVTAGVFRRVDYGLQAGVVYDYVREEWYANADVGQVRGDLSWVFDGGSAFGFRYTENVEDDTNAFNQTVNSVDWYRLYWRRQFGNRGYGEIFGGAADGDFGTIGMNCDVQLTSCIASQTGFTYFISDEDTVATGGRDSDAWNLYLGFSYRPRGYSWYNSYDRPMFDVADNGTLLLGRQ